MSFFSELKERRLVQIVVTYLAAGWIGVSVVDQLTQQEVLPALAYDLALIWYLAGIPAAFLVGWHHGEKGKQKAPLSEIVVLLALGISVTAFSGFEVADHLAREAAINAAEASALALDEVAVLYFDDLSPDGELQHVADGLTESLINQFAAVPGLNVVSRNGVEQFRDSDLPPDSIAAKLGVGTLVEGDIRKVGDRVRVNVALLEGQTGAPFGRRASFERNADEVFAIRDELAREVSRLLREWMGSELSLRRSRMETENPAAWVLYQRAEKARKEGEAAIDRHDGEAAAAAFARADSIADQVELLDSDWVAPMVLKGEIDYRRARALAHSRHDRVAILEEGEAEAERALALEPNNAVALGLRGTLRYYRYLQRMIHDHDEAQRLRAAARADFEQAVEIDPSLATVWSALQHVYYSESMPDAIMAGARAYEEDAYLESADDVLWRLYHGNFDSGNLDKARGWCEEGARRFPSNSRFSECQLQLLHTPAVEPDPDKAWRLAERIDSLAHPHRRDFARVQARMFVAGALARAGLADSARAVLDRAHDAAGPEIDPNRELLSIEAAMRSRVGEDDRAIDLLKQYRTVKPEVSFRHHWWWRTIRSHPRYDELETAAHD